MGVQIKGKYDKILYEILGKAKVAEGVFIALDGPLGPGMSHTISGPRMQLFINSLEETANTLRKQLGIPRRKLN